MVGTCYRSALPLSRNVKIQRNEGRRKRRRRTRGIKGSSFGAPRGERGREEGERKSRRTVRGGTALGTEDKVFSGLYEDNSGIVTRNHSKFPATTITARFQPRVNQ